MKPKLFINLILIGAIAVPVYAQSVLEEVVVTAQRREQNLQEVPVSVTAFTGATLENLKITEASQYLQLTPNVSYTEDGQVGSRGISISMRGVSNINTDESAFIQSIGIYLDEFSVASTANATINPQLLDLERVEVLRGPQGTYFGRNAVGGALNIRTKKPTDEFGWKITAGGRGYETRGSQYDVGLIFNTPLTDKFMTRGVIYYEDNSGIVKNIVPGGGDSGHEYLMGRLSARWLATDQTTVDVMVMYTDEDQGLDETVPSGVWDADTVATFALPSAGLATALDEGTGFYPNNRKLVSHSAIGEKNDNRSVVSILNIAHELTDEITLKSITGIIDTNNKKIFDNDLIAANVVNRFEQTNAVSWSSELRLEVSKDSYDWVTGFLYSRDTIKDAPLNTTGVVNGGLGVVTGPDRTASNGAAIGGLPPEFLTMSTLDGQAPLCLSCGQNKKQVESWAVFTDFTWHVNEKLDLIAGFRYTEDEVSGRTIRYNLSRTLRIPTIPSWGNKDTWDDFSPRFSVGYQATDDMRLYATVSKGYKAGGFTLGFNTTSGAPNQGIVNERFEDETLWNYEVGIKSEWLDNRLRLNASVFYLDWSDLQIETFFFTVPGDATSNIQRTINVEDAESMGFEIELLAAVTERLTISAGLGHTDTEIKSNDTARLSGNLTVNLQGEPLPRSPEWTWNMMAEYRWPWGEHEAYIQGEWVYRDSQFSTIEDVTYLQTSGQPVLRDLAVAPNGVVPDPDNTGAFLPNTLATIPDRSNGFPFISPDYHLINVRAGLIWNENWEANVYVNNLFDEEYYTGTGENFGLSGFRLRPHPRYFGGSVSYSFGGI